MIKLNKFQSSLNQQDTDDRSMNLLPERIWWKGEGGDTGDKSSVQLVKKTA